MPAKVIELIHSNSTISAAGGLVMRDGQVLLVYSKKGWEMPKGRAETGEMLSETAIREVLEETGYFCFLGEALPPVTYVTRTGESKTVQFWRMTVQSQISLKPLDSTIQSSRWFSPESAAAIVRHPHQREFIKQYAGRAT